MFDAIIFDFDGLILDTESSSVEAWREVYREYDVEFPLNLWLGNVGTLAHFDPLDHLEEALSRSVEREPIRARVQQRDKEIVHQREPQAGVMDRLHEARKLGLKRAIASSSPANWLNYHLPRLGLLFEFDAVRTRTDVGNRPKPDPAVYLAACEAVRVEPARAFALEDSLHGVLAAKKAGMRVVAVPTEVTRSLDFSEADLVIDSLAEMSIEEMMRRLEYG